MKRNGDKHFQNLPTGVSEPSFSLNTISVCPSIRNLGGRFARADSNTKHIAKISPNPQHSQISRCPFSLTLQVQLPVRDLSIVSYL